MVDSISVQLLASLEPRIKKLNPVVAVKVAEDIRERALDNTNEGRSFTNEPYDRNYRPKAKRDREKLNLQVAHVDFRRKQKRIERMRVKKPINADTGAIIGWDDAKHGEMFYGHQKGKGVLPVRRIFPESTASFPQDVHDNARKLAWGVLSGK